MQLLIKLRFYLTVLLALFPLLLPWPVTYVSTVWFLVSFIIIVWNIKKLSIKQILVSFLLSFPFFGFLIYSLTDLSDASLDLLGRNLFFLILPIGFCLSPIGFKKSEEKLIKRSFLAGTVGMILFFIIWWAIKGNHFNYESDKDLFFLIRSEFNTITKVHPGYGSLYICMAMLFVLGEWKSRSFKISIWPFVFIFLFISLLGLMARLPFITTILILIIWIFQQLKQNVKPFIKWGITGFFLVFISLIFISRFGRFSEFKNVQNATIHDQHENTLVVRKLIYDCSFSLMKEHLPIGIGPHHVQSELDKCYHNYNASVFSRHTFNTHNQYLDYSIGFGIFGLLFLIVVLFIPFLYFKKLPLEFLLFQILLGICMLAENVLSRQSGLIFYGFFNGYYWGQFITESISVQSFFAKKIFD